MKIDIKIFLLFFLIQLLCFSTIKSQTNSDIKEQIWIDVNPSYLGIPGIELYGDAGIRWRMGNSDWIRLVLRPSIRLPMGKGFYFSTGLGNFYSINQTFDNRWEIRPFQGVSYTWPRGKIPLRHYVRLEERFDFNTTTWKPKNSLRFRYQLKISHRWSAFQPDRYWQASAIGEAFFTFAGDQGQYQEYARVTVGLDRSFSYDLHFRFEVTWQQQQLFYDPGASASDIYFRLRYTRRWGRD